MASQVLLVLDRKRKTEQRSAIAVVKCLLNLVCFPKRVIAADGDQGVQPGVQPIDAVEIHRDQLADLHRPVVQ